MYMLNKNMTFSELSHVWLLKSLPGLCYSYQCQLKSDVKHLNEFLGDKKIKDIKSMDIDELILQRAEKNPNTGKPMSKKMLRDLCNVSYQIFEMAIDNQLLFYNPARNRKKCIPKNAPQKIVKAIPLETQQLIISVPHRARIAAMIMMFLGCRSGEVIALEWEDIDIDNCRVPINKRAQRTGKNEYTVIPGTKNGKERYAQIPKNLCKWLEKQKSMAKSLYVCPKLDGNLHTPSSWKNLWRGYQLTLNYYFYISKLNENDKIPSKYNPQGIPVCLGKINPHQLRHTYATLLYLSGVDVVTASKLMGHSSVKITVDIYTHFDEIYKCLNIDKLDNYIKTDLDQLY